MFRSVSGKPLGYLSAALVLLIAGCGGGGGDSTDSGTQANSYSSSSSSAGASSSSTSSATSSLSSSSAGSSASTASSSATSGLLSVACSGSNCAAASATEYSGSGIGIWSSGSSTSARQGTFTLSGVSGKTVTLIWTNLSSTAKTGTLSATANVSHGGGTDAAQLREAMEASKPFVASGLTNGAQQLSASVSSNIQASYTVGSSTRSWYDAVTGTTLSTVLRQQAGLSNGQNLNVWVQNSAWTATGASNKVTQTLVDLVSSEFANSGTGIFDLATSVAGQPWGTTGNANLISSSQDIHIVVTNFTNDNTASSVLGYFYAANNFLKTTSGMGNSNEALVFFIDAQSLASAATMYQDIMVSTLAHEFTHMINFYQREVLKGSSYGFDTWLEEASAMMMEDLLNPLIITSFNDIRDSRIPGWLAAGINNCSLNVYDANSSTCFSYNIGAAYGAYLLRQYGVGFYKTLLQSDNTDSLTALEKSIAASDSSAGFLSSLPRWGASIALLDSSLLPTGFGYPARSVSVNGNSYTVPALNGPDYASDRKLSSLPNSLKAYAHAAQSYSASGSTFSRTVSIPANTVLTVVVN